jgi:hypothetical protein
MTVLARLDQWQRAGAISAAQHDAIAALVRKDRFPVFVELNALLYIGVLSMAGGVAWTVAAYADRIGDVAIVAALTCAFAGALSYCFTHAHPYANRPIEHEGLAFDYVLYFGCLLLATDIGYIQSRLHPFQLPWDRSLLLASTVFFALAYRFDNRFVLSLALSSLAGWFGVRLGGLHSLRFAGALRPYALSYGGLVAGAGIVLHRTGIKPHFLETYLHVAINVLFLALLSGVGASGATGTAYLLTVLGLSATTIVQGVRFKRFAFVVYGVLYGYAGISGRLLRDVRSFSAGLTYFVISGAVVVVALVALARSFGRDA